MCTRAHISISINHHMRAGLPYLSYLLESGSAYLYFPAAEYRDYIFSCGACACVRELVCVYVRAGKNIQADMLH